LPKVVREELNRRLEDGEQGGRLVEWLNAREDVQAVLKANFGGCPINEQNLTRWRQGGYDVWLQRQESLDVAGWLVEESKEVTGLTPDRLLGDRAADMAALALAELLMATRRVQEGAEKEKSVLRIVRGLVRLRRADRECERGRREAEAAAMRQGPVDGFDGFDRLIAGTLTAGKRGVPQADPGQTQRLEARAKPVVAASDMGLPPLNEDQPE
jgi:hypothetical protein